MISFDQRATELCITHSSHRRHTGYTSRRMINIIAEIEFQAKIDEQRCTLDVGIYYSLEQSGVIPVGTGFSQASLQLAKLIKKELSFTIFVQSGIEIFLDDDEEKIGI
ncbi:hypothetical protein T11_9648 [Trichinella zimbabwensis]|uniref:Uncharacterized protein n=1 Tax=Trichinella zimbabwensis TaxID=268475 RepID=A0A0V1H7W5_9BILA|nr:hypothetical protein T11_9648 [Trichinella zimbabwensis]